MFEWSPGLPIVDEIIPLSDDEETDDVVNESDDELDNIEPIDAENDDGSDDRIIVSDDSSLTNEGESAESGNEDSYAEDYDDPIMQDTLETIDEHEHNESEKRILEEEGEEEEEEEEEGEYETDESEECPLEKEVPNQNETDRPRRAAAGRGIDRLEMSFDGKVYAHGRERQFLMVQEEQNNEPTLNDYYSIACNVMLTQMSAKEGIKRFGERAIVAMIKEYEQMDKAPMPGKPVFCPVSYESLTKEEIMKAMEN